MERTIVKSSLMLRGASEEATADDLPVAQDLLDTLAAHADECAGLAANMIGVRKRIIAFDDKGTPCAMLNPTLIQKRGAYEAQERCLSLTGERTTTRYRSIRVRYQDLDLTWHERSYTGWTAQVIQHEVDHCDGIVI